MFDTGLGASWVDCDLAQLTASERLDYLIASAALQARLAGREQRVLAAVAVDTAGLRLSEQDSKRFIREELACALNISDGWAGSRLDLAQVLVEQLPATLALLEAGRLDYARARAIAESVTDLSQVQIAELETRVLARACDQNLAGLRRSLRRVLVKLDPARFEKTHTDADQARGVWACYGADGMGELYATATAEQIAQVMAVLNGIAAEKIPGETRTADQRRSDALMELAAGGLQTCGVGIVVTVPTSTLLGEDELAGQLANGTLLPASLARKIATDTTGTWRRLVTDPTGQVTDYGRTRYRPPTDLDEHVRIRDQHCRFPGCHRVAKTAELDHVTAWNDHGHTKAPNLMVLGARHHHLKHETSWHVTRDHHTGTVTWKSPQKRVYQTHPPDLPGPEPRPTSTPAWNIDLDPPPF